MDFKLSALLLLVSLPATCLGRQSFFVNIPNMVRLDISEPISIIIEDVKEEATVKVKVQDDSKRDLWTTEGTCRTGSPTLLYIKVKQTQVKFLNAEEKKFLTVQVVLSAGSLKFEKSARILISRRSRNVFIQTDKPIYTPKQAVRFRIIPVNVELKPAMALGITVEVKNPDGKITQRWERLVSYRGYVTKEFTLGDNPLIGNWTVSAKYSGQNTSVQFEVREYVLPRYIVKIDGPPFIVPGDKNIKVTVISGYVYEKPVNGRVELKFGIINDRDETISIISINDRLLMGKATFSLPTKVIKDHKSGIWFPDGDRLLLSATVTEASSGHKETTVDSSIYFSTTPYQVSFKRSLKFFKPGLPYQVQMTVRYPSKRPAVFTKMMVRGIVTTRDKKSKIINDYKGSGLTVVTDANGKGQITLDIPQDSIDLVIQAKQESSLLPFDRMKKFRVQPAVSRSKSYMVIRTPSAVPKVGEIIQFEVVILTSKRIAALHYMVISRGQVQLSRTHERPGAVTIIPCMVTRAMSPEIRLVAYFQVEHEGKGDIVADQVVVDVEDKFSHKVSIQTAKKEYRPGEKANLVVKGEPNSNAAILAVDRSIYLLREDHRLSSSLVFNRMKNFDLGCGYGGGKDSSAVFKDAGLLVITNSDGLEVQARKSASCELADTAGGRKRRSVEEHKCCELGEKSRSLAMSCRNSLEKLDISDSCRKWFMKCCKGDRGRSSLIFEDQEEDAIAEDDRQVQFRSNFPETWLFGDVLIGPTGTAELQVVVPDSITTWILQAFAQSTSTGLGVAPPFEMVSFKPFFLQLNLPYSVVRGEHLQLSATIFNYAKRRIMSKVYMRAGQELCYERGSGDRSSQQLVRIKENDALTLKYSVVPVELGYSNITFIAYTADGGDAVTRKILIEPEGVEKVKSVSRQIDPSAESTSSQTLTMNADTPKDTIPGSESATLFITGDLLGPIATKLLSGASQALRNPVQVYQVSSTETFTVSVPVSYTYTRTENVKEYYRSYEPSCTCNVRSGGCMRSRIVARTVTATGNRNVLRTRTRTVWRQRDRFILQSIAPNVYVLRYLKRVGKLDKKDKERGEGFIQESYRRLLGHRTKDGSFSMWGNAIGTLWLTAFVMKNLQDAREFITVDETVICQAMTFVLKSQKENGAFLQEDEGFSKGMMGGINGDPAMTAFILITLQRATCPQLTTSLGESVQKAESYLKSKLQSTKRSYDLSLIAYALALAGSDKRYDALDRLQKAAIINADQKTMHWGADSESVAVETTAYALLAFLELRKLTLVKPILKWLIEHRKADGGFSSGQDTVVALEALSRYSSLQPALSLKLMVKSTSDSSYRRQMLINRRNALVQQSVEVPVGGDIIITATGSGIGEAQLEMHYNGPKPPASCPFKLEADIKTIEDSQSYTVNLTTCMRFLGKGTVGMSTVEIGLPTGFIPIKASLEDMLNSGKIARFELGERAVVVYLTRIDKVLTTCLTLGIRRAFDVGHLQPATITVKDSLNEDISCSKLYRLSSKEVLSGKICKGGKCSCTQARCPACSPRRIKRYFCSREYACKVKVTSTREEGSWVIVSATVKELYKGGEVLRIKQTVELWLDKQCRCPSIRSGEKYLVMGYFGTKLMLDRQTFVRRLSKQKKASAENEAMSRLRGRC